MNIIGIQNCKNTNYLGTTPNRAAAEAPRYHQINQYNPVCYMPAFKSQTTDRFVELFEKGLETDLSKKESEQLSYNLYKVKKEVMSDKDSFMGEGHVGSTYKINDDYILKVDKNSPLIKKKKFNYVKDDTTNNIPYYYGGVLATCDNLSILKNADPKGQGIVLGKPRWLKDDQKTEYVVNKSLPALAELPQTSYDNYALTLKKLNDTPFGISKKDTRYSPDAINPNNFMIVDNEIRFVDELLTLHNGRENDLSTMCAPFLNKSMELADADKNAETIDSKREIFKKCVLASEEAELGTPHDITNYFNFKNVMEICDYKTDVKDFIHFIDSARAQEPDKELRKQQLSDYLDNLN